MSEFTPLSGLAGGVMIGAAAALLLLLNGRIAGISGIAGGVMTAAGEERLWRVAFLVGLIVGPLAVAALTGAMPEVAIQANWPAVKSKLRPSVSTCPRPDRQYRTSSPGHSSRRIPPPGSASSQPARSTVVNPARIRASGT